MEEKEVIQTPKKKSMMPLVLFLLVLVALGVGGYFVAQKFIGKKTPKEVFVSSIEKTLSKTSNIKTKDFKTLTDEFNINVKITSPLMQNDVFDIINKFDVKGKLAIDVDKNILFADLATTYDKLDLLNFSTYLENDQMYIMFSDAIDKWIKFDMGDQSFNFNETISSMNIDLDKSTKGMEAVEDALLNSLKDEYFTKEKVDGGSKITLTIDKTNIKDILTSTLKELKDSKEFKDFYKEISGSDNIDSEINEVIKSLEKADFSSIGKIVVDVYANSKNELKKLEMTFGEGMQEVTIELEQKDADTLEFAIKTQGIKMFSGSIVSKENNGKGTMTISLSFMEMINIELNIEEKISYDAKIEKVDISNSIDSNDVTEADLDKVTNTAGFKKLMKDIEEMDLSELMGNFGLDESTTTFGF